MNDETKPKEETKVEETEEKVSIVDEARALRDEIIKARDEIKQENDRKEKMMANDLLGGSTGGHVEEEVKEETPRDYADKVLKGEFN